MNVFIAGPRVISKFDNAVKERLYSICEKNYTVLVGDANGVDKSIQNFFFELKYKNVVVFASEGKARNNIGNWTVEKVPVDKKLRGFEYYEQKDIAMANNADYGFMIWNGESKGTLNNIINLISNNKKILVYYIPKNQFFCINSEISLNSLLMFCPKQTQELYQKLVQNKHSLNTQISLLDSVSNKS